ncbi:MAG: MFS transporter, partial [Candidatus Omnitrophica bacterium]|nr:MFS transporter [Candidatus Omnitrophota bacterium]
GIYLSRVYQFTQFQISIYFIIAALGGMFGQLLGGVLSDKKGRLVSCRAGILGLSLGIMLLFGTYSAIFLGLVIALVSIGWTVGHNGLSTVLTDFPDEDRPMIASLNSSIRFISGGIGFCVSAYFVEKNFGLTFFVIGILMLLLSFVLRKVIPQN